MNALTIATAMIARTRTKTPSSCRCKNILRFQYRSFRPPQSWRRRRFSTNKGKRSPLEAKIPLQSPPRSPPRCFYTSWTLTARVYFSFPLTEMCYHGRLCDRLRLCGNVHFSDRLRLAICDLRSFAIVCDHVKTTFANRLIRPGSSHRW